MTTLEVLTPDDLARELRVDVGTVYRALAEGRLPGEKVCGRWRTLASDLEEILRGPTKTPRKRGVQDPMPTRKSPRRSSFREQVVDIHSRSAS